MGTRRQCVRDRAFSGGFIDTRDVNRVYTIIAKADAYITVVTTSSVVCDTDEVAVVFGPTVMVADVVLLAGVLAERLAEVLAEALEVAVDVAEVRVEVEELLLVVNVKDTDDVETLLDVDDPLLVVKVMVRFG